MRAGLPYEPAVVRQHARAPFESASLAEAARCRPAVYALGLYVDPAAVQQRVAPKFQGQAPDALARSQQLLDGARPGPAAEPSLGRCASSRWTVRALSGRRSFPRAVRSSCWTGARPGPAARPALGCMWRGAPRSAVKHACYQSIHGATGKPEVLPPAQIPETHHACAAHFT